jgi:hypothetical protein
MKGKLAITLLASSLFADTIPLRVSLTHQPVEAFIATFGSKVRGVGLYGIRTCNKSLTPVTVNGSWLLQVAESTTLAPVDYTLTHHLADKAKRGSLLYRAMKVTGWASLIGSVITGSGAVEASHGVQVTLPLFGIAAERAGSELTRRDYGRATLIDPDHEYPMVAGGCVGGSFVGAYRAPFNTVIVETSVER